MVELMFEAVKKLQETTDNNFGVTAGLMASVTELKLQPEQIIAFCDATPNGSELWEQMTSRRDSPDTPAGYNFMTFVKEILAKTSHPVLT